MLYFLLFFFFFKQKTAYEMRISDWSSDVCSSDLVDIEAVCRGAGRAAVAEFRDERSLYGIVDVGVFEDYERRVSAELHGRTDDLVGGFVEKGHSDFRGASEREVLDTRVVKHAAHAGTRWGRRNDVDDPGR